MGYKAFLLWINLNITNYTLHFHAIKMSLRYYTKVNYIYKLYFTKLRLLCIKNTTQRVKRQPQNGPKYLQTMHLKKFWRNTKSLVYTQIYKVSRIYKNTNNSTRKRHTTQLKNE